VLTLIARQATGAMRDAESLLDQLAASSDTITLAQAQSTLGAGPIEIISAIAEGLANGDAARGWTRSIRRSIAAQTRGSSRGRSPITCASCCY